MFLSIVGIVLWLIIGTWQTIDNKNDNSNSTLFCLWLAIIVIILNEVNKIFL